MAKSFDDLFKEFQEVDDALLHLRAEFLNFRRDHEEETREAILNVRRQMLEATVPLVNELMERREEAPPGFRPMIDHLMGTLVLLDPDVYWV